MESDRPLTKRAVRLLSCKMNGLIVHAGQHIVPSERAVPSCITIIRNPCCATLINKDNAVRQIEELFAIETVIIRILTKPLEHGADCATLRIQSDDMLHP